MIAGFTELSLAFALRMILSIIYFISGAVKIFDIEGFYRLLKNYRMFSDITYELVAYFMPIIQLVLGILLFTKSYALIVLSATTLLQFFLTILTIIAIKKRGQLRNSGMFGTAVETRLTWKVVLLNIILFFASSYLLISVISGLEI